MQFRLKTLFVMMTLVAAYFGLIFSAPIVLTSIVLTLTMGASPAVWIAGAIYCRGGRQAFFVGGVAAGVLPFIISLYYFVTFGVTGAISMSGGQGLMGAFRSDDYNLETRVAYALIWPISGVFSITGGIAACLVRRHLGSQQHPVD